MQPTISWDHLRFALAVERCGSLAGAARDLGVELSTVIRRIEALEGEVGARLFLRTPSGLAATGPGKVVLSAAARVEEEVLHAERLLGADLAGPVRIAMTESTAERLLLQGGLALVEKLGGIELELLIGNQPVDLARREAEVAIRLMRPRGAGIVASRVGYLHFGLFAAPSYIERCGRPNATNLARHTVVLGAGELASSPEGSWMARASRGARVALRTNGLVALRAALLSGIGVGVLPIPAAAMRGPLTCVHKIGRSVRREVYLVYHQDLRRSERVRAGIEAAISVLAPNYSKE
jgi:DNA-binding transcriptional LysR family regulator